METIKQGIMLEKNWYLWCLLDWVVKDCLSEGTFEPKDTIEFLAFSKQKFILYFICIYSCKSLFIPNHITLSPSFPRSSHYSEFRIYPSYALLCTFTLPLYIRYQSIIFWDLGFWQWWGKNWIITKNTIYLPTSYNKTTRQNIQYLGFQILGNKHFSERNETKNLSYIIVPIDGLEWISRLCTGKKYKRGLWSPRGEERELAQGRPASIYGIKYKRRESCSGRGPNEYRSTHVCEETTKGQWTTMRKIQAEDFPEFTQG